MTEREWDKRLRIKTIGRENEDNPHHSPISRLSHMPEVEHVDTIDCRDLFNGKNDRERIEVFRLMNVDRDTGDRHSRTVPDVPPDSGI